MRIVLCRFSESPYPEGRIQSSRDTFEHGAIEKAGRGLADTYAIRFGFIMPLICFVYVMFYATFWPALERLDTGHEVAG